jgi:hypothetical protein
MKSSSGQQPFSLCGEAFFLHRRIGALTQNSFFFSELEESNNDNQSMGGAGKNFHI